MSLNLTCIGTSDVLEFKLKGRCSVENLNMERFRTWHEILMERLSDPEDVIGYLEVSLEEYLEDGDKAFFLKGIKNVIEAQGGILSVSEQAGVDPRFLSDAINNGSMPPFHILNSIFTSFGAVSLISKI